MDTENKNPETDNFYLSALEQSSKPVSVLMTQGVKTTRALLAGMVNETLHREFVAMLDELYNKISSFLQSYNAPMLTFAQANSISVKQIDENAVVEAVKQRQEALRGIVSVYREYNLTLANFHSFFKDEKYAKEKELDEIKEFFEKNIGLLFTA